MKSAAILLSTLALVSHGAPTIENIAGTGKPGFAGDGGPADTAAIANPFGVIRAPDGAIVFCDTDNHRVRKIDADGKISTVAGNGDRAYAGDGGPATEAAMNEPYEIRLDGAGNLFVVERLNHVVRRVDARTGTIETVAGTGGKSGFGGDRRRATSALLHEPHSIALDASGTHLYIADIKNHRVRVVDLGSGRIETLAGNGERRPTPDGAKFADVPLNGPRALDFDADGDLWLALREGNAVYRLDLGEGTIHHVAGSGDKGFTGNGGPAATATLSGPKGVAVGPDGNIYLADTESHSIRMIDRGETPPILRLIAGDGTRGDGPVDGAPTACRLARPHGVFVDQDGNLLIGDSEAHRVRVVRLP